MSAIASTRPSQTVLRQAAELGCEMARSWPLLQPNLHRAYRYDDYHRFRNAHREQWERTDVFISVWQDRLFALADKEGRRLGLRMDDSMTSWDVWYDDVVVPMKHVLWEAWEHNCNLQALYAKAAKQIGVRPAPPMMAEDPSPSRVSRVAEAAQLVSPEDLGASPVLRVAEAAQGGVTEDPEASPVLRVAEVYAALLAKKWGRPVCPVPLYAPSGGDTAASQYVGTD